jgi:xanthosine utilization system XapX-like protein
VGIWTVTGFLVGVALSLVVGSFPVPALICAVLGLLFGLFMTRQKFVPDED